MSFLLPSFFPSSISTITGNQKADAKVKARGSAREGDGLWELGLIMLLMHWKQLVGYDDG